MTVLWFIDIDLKFEWKIIVLTPEKLEILADDVLKVERKLNCSYQGKDDFSHEQNLLITENESVLIIGCGHAGVINIMEKPAYINLNIV